MKAVVCSEHGLPEKLSLDANWPDPEPGEHDDGSARHVGTVHGGGIAGVHVAGFPYGGGANRAKRLDSALLAHPVQKHGHLVFPREGAFTAGAQPARPKTVDDRNKKAGTVIRSEPNEARCAVDGNLCAVDADCTGGIDPADPLLGPGCPGRNIRYR